MGKPLVSPALTTALRRSCRARDLGPGSSVITLRSVPSDDWIDETMMLLCSVGRPSPDDSSVVPDHDFVTKPKKRVTRVTRFLAAEEVGFEPTVPVDTAVFETARFGRSRTPPSTSLQRTTDRLLAVTGSLASEVERRATPYSSCERKRCVVVDATLDEAFMRRALEAAKDAAQHGDVPVGCVLVKNGVF